MVKGVKGFNLDAYLLALEGWRRGLTLTWYYDPSQVTDLKIIGFFPLGKSFSLSDGKKTHFFYRSRGDKVHNTAVDICSDKHLTKKKLSEANVKVPNGKRFDIQDSEDEILTFTRELGFPLVVKPTYGSLGKGVSINVNSETEVLQSVEHIAQIGYDDFIVERFFAGDDLRVYVVNDQVVAATRRVPANVIGDGKSTIRQLIENKNKKRSENPYLAKYLITIDDNLIEFIAKKGFNLESVPTENETVYLRGAANIAAGGDPIDVTDQLSDDVKMLAIQAIKAIPGLHHAGVDILVNEDSAVVIEINTTSDISMHLFPFEGKPRNVPEPIIDDYFPETKGLAVERTKIYFDYRKINNLLQRAVVQEFQVTDAPAGKLYAKRYVLSGKVQKVGFRKWIRREALKRNLHGYVRNLRNGKVVVVVGSDNKKLVDDFKNICLQGPPKAKVDNIQEYVWDTQMKVGFEIRRTRTSKTKKKL